MANSLQDILKRRREMDFCGRREELEFFTHNLDLADLNRSFIINIYGQGGVGKSTLLHRFRQIAQDAGAVTATTDDTQHDVPEVMGRIAECFASQGVQISEFFERYDVYRRLKQEIAIDPQAPQALSPLARRAPSGRPEQGALSKLRRQVADHWSEEELHTLCFDLDVDYDSLPGEGKDGKARELVSRLKRRDRIPELVALCAKRRPNVAWDYAPHWQGVDGGIIDPIDQFNRYVAGKIQDSDDVRLVLEPVEVLTPLLLTGLRDVAQTRSPVLFFDTYEQTVEFLDPWLRNLLEFTYGDLPGDILLVVAGRVKLDRNLWSPYHDLLHSQCLDPFTEEEARDYLARKEITDERVIDVILKLSGRLPLLLVTLATASPHDPAEIGDPSGEAVERFLQWVRDPQRKQMAMDAALPRKLNRDVLAVLVGEEQAGDLFEWLEERPFVDQRGDGWIYHDIVRDQMLRYKRLETPGQWADLHGELAAYYERLRDNLGLEEAEGRQDTTWQGFALEALYHRLCQAPYKYLPLAANGCFDARKVQTNFARRQAETIEAAGTDRDAGNVRDLGRELVAVFNAVTERRYADALEMFPDVMGQLKALGVKEDELPAALSLRGGLYLETGREQEALEDWERSVDLDPADAWSLCYRGVVYSGMQRYEEALADFDRALELKPDYAKVFTFRGETYREMERYDEAFADFDQAIELNPKYAWSVAHRGQAYQQMERYNEALADFDRAIELDPDYAWAIGRRAETYRDMERYDEAMADLNRLVEMDPEDDWALTYRGQIYRLMKQYDNALADLDRVIELDPEYAWAIGERALVYRKLKQYENAIADFTRRLELDPDSAWVIGQRGRTYRLMERFEEALADFNRAIELDPEYAWAIASRGATHRQRNRYEESLVDLDRAIELDSDSAFAFGQRGTTHELIGSYGKALADLSRSLELNPDAAWVILERGATYRRMGKFEKALVDLGRAIELNPDEKRGTAYRGETYRLMERHEEAVADFDRAIELDPDYHWAYECKGIALRQLERYEEAVQALDEAIRTDPTCSSGFAHRGEAYRKMKRYDQALADFDRAIELDPDYRWAIAARGQTCWQVGRYEEAIANLDRAIALDSDNAWQFAQRGVTYQRMERYEEALADLNQSLALDPDAAWVVGTRGQTYRQMGRYEEALTDLNRAIELDPDSASRIAKRGGMYQMMGQYEEALADFARAIEIGPEEDWYLYQRAITHRVMGQMEESQADLSAALGIAEQKHTEDPDDHRKTCNLALYRMVSGEAEAAQQLYEDVLSSDVSRYRVRTAVHEINDFLALFPDHRQARTMIEDLTGRMSTSRMSTSDAKPVGSGRPPQSKGDP